MFEVRIDADLGDDLIGDEGILELTRGRIEVHRNGRAALGLVDTKATGGGGSGEKGVELFSEDGHVDAVLRALRSGDARDDAGEIELEEVGVVALALVGNTEETLGLVIIFHRGAKLFAATGAAEVTDRLAVDGEETHRRAVFGGHVRDRGAVGQGEGGGAGSEELDELADDAVLPQDFGDAQGEVGRGDAFLQFTVEVDADNLGDEEGDGLPEHAGFGFDPADAPANDAESVDHGRVRVGADEGVGVINAVLGENPFREILEVHLVDDTDTGRHDREGLESLLTPLEELVALAVADELDRHVAVQGEL